MLLSYYLTNCLPEDGHEEGDGVERLALGAAAVGDAHLVGVRVRARVRVRVRVRAWVRVLGFESGLGLGLSLGSGLG